MLLRNSIDSLSQAAAVIDNVLRSAWADFMGILCWCLVAMTTPC